MMSMIELWHRGIFDPIDAMAWIWYVLNHARTSFHQYRNQGHHCLDPVDRNSAQNFVRPNRTQATRPWHQWHQKWTWPCHCKHSSSFCSKTGRGWGMTTSQRSIRSCLMDYPTSSHWSKTDENVSDIINNNLGLLVVLRRLTVRSIIDFPCSTTPRVSCFPCIGHVKFSSLPLATKSHQ